MSQAQTEAARAPLVVSIGRGITSKKLTAVIAPWDRLISDQFASEQLKVTRAQWDALPDDQRSAIKLGQRYIVGGPTTGVRGGKGAGTDWVLGRNLITLDIDKGPADLVERLAYALVDLGVAAYIYPTISSRPGAPSLRVLVPTASTIATDDYHLAARIFATGLALGDVVIDRASLVAGQIMFGPSHFIGEDPKAQVIQGNPWDAADALDAWGGSLPPTLFGEATITKAPRPISTGPATAGEREAAGVIGAFNACYTAREAILQFLPGVYDQHPTMPTRMRLAGKHGVGGLSFYDGDRVCFSFHDNDPLNLASDDGRRHLHDAFGVVYIHGGKSMRATVAWASELPPVAERLRREIIESLPNLVGEDGPAAPAVAYSDPVSGLDWIAEDDGVEADPWEEAPVAPRDGAGPTVEVVGDSSWKQGLERTKTGIAATLQNVALIIANAMPSVKYNAQAGRIFVSGHEVTDYHRARVRHDLQAAFKMPRIPACDFNDGLLLGSRARTFHPLRDYLKSVKWDGVSRIDNWLVALAKADDTKYTRAVGRLFALGAVARAFEPGCQYDSALVLVAGQGAGKGRLIRALAKDWYRELATDFHDDARMAESTQGAWVVEIAEMAGARRAEDESLKRYITRRDDRFRQAYAHEVESRLRSFVLVGTSNVMDFLRDSTGERRWQPVWSPCNAEDTIQVPEEDWINQFWAEGVFAFQEMRAASPDVARSLPLFLGDDERREAAAVADRFKAENLAEQWAGIFEAYLDGGPTQNSEFGVKRDQVCLIELWVECLHGHRNNYPNSAAQAVARAMKLLPNWEFAGKARVPMYGIQRVFVRAGRGGEV